ANVLAVYPSTPPYDAPTLVNSVSPGTLGVTDICEGGDNHGVACTSDAECSAGGGTCEGVVATILGIPGLTFYHDGRGVVTNTFLAAIDFEIRGNIIAARVSEGEFGSTATDYNMDGDNSDTDMFAIDLVTDQVINTHQAVVHCELPGCEPGLPYKI